MARCWPLLMQPVVVVIATLIVSPAEMRFWQLICRKIKVSRSVRPVDVESVCRCRPRMLWSIWVWLGAARDFWLVAVGRTVLPLARTIENELGPQSRGEKLVGTVFRADRHGLEYFSRCCRPP